MGSSFVYDHPLCVLSIFNSVVVFLIHSKLKFEKVEINVSLPLWNKNFELYHRPLWCWITDVLSDPVLVSQCTWDAQKLSKFDRVNFMCFIHKPWTADEFWNVQVISHCFRDFCSSTGSRLLVLLQSVIPSDGKPLGLIIYTDKTKLSSFGSVTGYPVIASIANLPSDIRHGTGLGANCVVGWLPVVGSFILGLTML